VLKVASRGPASNAQLEGDGITYQVEGFLAFVVELGNELEVG